jgi:hypothetical protein
MQPFGFNRTRMPVGDHEITMRVCTWNAATRAHVHVISSHGTIFHFRPEKHTRGRVLVLSFSPYMNTFAYM